MQYAYNTSPNTRYVGLYRLRLRPLVIRDPDLIKQLTVKDFDHFTDHISIGSESPDSIWSRNLFALKGDKWRDMRMTLSPSFTSSKMKTMFGLVIDASKRFVQYFEDQQQGICVAEMKDCYTRFTNDVIATAAFGVVCDSLKDRKNNFFVMGNKLTNFSGLSVFFRATFASLAPKLSRKLGIRIFSPEVIDFFRSLVKENIRAREARGIVRPDMIHLLMQAKKTRETSVEENCSIDEGFAVVEELLKPTKQLKRQLSEEDIAAQALIFFFAGFDTVSTQMCFTSYELAVNPDVQKRLQEEIDGVYKECDGNVTYDMLLKMKYLDMVLSESLRKWPPIVIIDRICVSPYTIAPVHPTERPVHINKGDLLWIPTFGLHRDPRYYPDPERFDPERFGDENKSKIKPYTYLPFGVGPRSCIGNRFALMEIKALFFYLLSKYDIVVVDKTRVPLKLEKNGMQMNAEGGFWLGFKKRTSQN